LLVCDSAGRVVHRVTGDARRAFERVAQGDGVLPDDHATAALVAAKVIASADGEGADPPGERMSRRQVLALGAAAMAAAGVVTVALPGAAAAQSPGPTTTTTLPPVTVPPV